MLMVFERSSALLSGPPAASYCTYSIGDSESPLETGITLLEARTTIEAGTTGLRTWKAAFSFAEWLLHYPGEDLVTLRQWLGVLTGGVRDRPGKVGPGVGLGSRVSRHIGRKAPGGVPNWRSSLHDGL